MKLLAHVLTLSALVGAMPAMYAVDLTSADRSPVSIRGSVESALIRAATAPAEPAAARLASRPATRGGASRVVLAAPVAPAGQLVLSRAAAFGRSLARAVASVSRQPSVVRGPPSAC